MLWNLLISFAIKVPSLESNNALFWLLTVSFISVLAQTIKLLSVVWSFSIISFFLSIIALNVSFILSFNVFADAFRLPMFSSSFSIM